MRIRNNLLLSRVMHIQKNTHKNQEIYHAHLLCKFGDTSKEHIQIHLNKIK